jgi:hypothetical protein
MKEGDLTTEQQCQMIAEASGWRARALAAEAALATLSPPLPLPEVERLIEAADYYIDRWRRVALGETVRDVPEALGEYESAKRAALSALPLLEDRHE